MTDTLSHAFRAGNRRTTTWQGHTVYSYVTLSVSEGARVHLTRIASSPVRAQALKVCVDRGDLRANGVLASPIAIWSHTAPETATLEVVGRRARSIDVWNAWSLDGVDSAWLGHAGMLIEGDGHEYTLRCSDGLDSVSFTDLVVQVEIESRG